MSKSTRVAVSLVTAALVFIPLCVFGLTSVGAGDVPQGFVGAVPMAQQLPPSELQQGVNGYLGCLDTYISAWHPDQNYCSDAELRVKADTPIRTLIRFDLSGITPVAQVDAGHVELYIRTGNPGFNSLRAHKVRRDWDCGQANWRYARSGDRWGQDGCRHPDVDYYYDAEGNGYPSLDRPGFYRLEINRQTLQSWLNDPATNKGLVLVGEGGYDYFAFSSSEEPLEARRPVLTIKWTPAVSATPSPAPTHTPYPTYTPFPTFTPQPTATPPVPTPTSTPSILRVTITAYPRSLSVGETSSITVTAQDGFGNNVPDGTVVTFTTSLGTFGDALSSTTRTTLNGKATVALHSGEAGTAAVQGTVGTQSATIAITFGAGSPHSISLTVAPGVIPGCGGTAMAEAQVKDDRGDPVPDGTVVVFDVTPQGEVEPILGGTTTYGVARAMVSSGTLPGPATVWAWWGHARTSVVADFPVVFLVGPADQVTLSAEPPGVVVGGGHATLRLQALDCAGYPVADGTPVTFTVASGEGSLSPMASTTTRGWALSTLTSPNETGSATIRATVGDRRVTAVVEYIPARPFDIALAAVPPSIPADGTSASTIVVEVRDMYGNTVADRTIVALSTNSGCFETGSSCVIHTGAGRATAVLTSSNTPGTARVEAVAGGRRAEIGVDFYPVSHPTPTPQRQWSVYLPSISTHQQR
jgi:hypothetical protein